MIIFDFKNLKIARSNKSLDYKNLKFFKIIRVINNNVYELKLSNNIQNIYSIFHFWLLHLINVNFFSSQKEKRFNLVSINIEKTLFFIEEIFDVKMNKKKVDSKTDRKNNSISKKKKLFSIQNTLNEIRSRKHDI